MVATFPDTALSAVAILYVYVYVYACYGELVGGRVHWQQVIHAVLPPILTITLFIPRMMYAAIWLGVGAVVSMFLTSRCLGACACEVVRCMR